MSVLPFWDNPANPVGKRLKQAIVDAGLDETSVVARGIVSRQQLVSMLHGAFDNVSGAVFQRMANQRIDIRYVFTGIKASAPTLKEDEAKLLDNYRHTSPERQASLREVGSAFAEPKLSIAPDGTHADRGRGGR